MNIYMFFFFYIINNFCILFLEKVKFERVRKMINKNLIVRMDVFLGKGNKELEKLKRLF